MRTALVALAVLAIAACGGESATAPTLATTGPAATGIAGPTLDGTHVSLDQFRGRPVLVNVWSSW